jgi:hypothetical protein
MEDEDANHKGKDERGRFTRGNLFSIGNTGGRPPMYKNATEINIKLAEYLDFEDFLKKQGQGKGLYTIEGAMLYLGFASRQSFHDNIERDSEFSYVLNRFKLFLTHWNVQKLYWGGTMPGSKFWLTNHGGYTEESTQHQIVSNVEASFNKAVYTTHESREDSRGDQQ